MTCLCSGIRGEINVLVKVDLFNDLNRFRQSSCGVKFFCSKYLNHLLPLPPVHLYFIWQLSSSTTYSALLTFLSLFSSFSENFHSHSLFLQQPPFPDVTGPLWFMALWKSLWWMRIQSTSGSTVSEPLVHPTRPDRDSSFSCQVLIHKLCSRETKIYVGDMNCSISLHILLVGV